MEISGEVKKIVYCNPVNNYSIFIMNSEDTEITAIGFVKDLCIGNSMKLNGEFTREEDCKEYFKIDSYE